MTLWNRFENYLGLVRFSHTIFALPFALVSMIVAADGLPAWRVIGWILFCMVMARTAAMTFNRIVDRHMDALNPRTKDRHLPAGKVSLLEANLLFLITSALFVFGAWQLNLLAFWLSPVALAVVCGYSLSKRFFSFCHIILGLSLAIAPVGAWIGVTGTLAWPSLILAAAVLFWVTGFDIIYALMDEDFDRKMGIHSAVVKYGPVRALRIAFGLHLVCILFIVLFGILGSLGWIYYAGCGFFGGLIVYQHTLVAPEDISNVNIAFFNVNGTISIGLLCFTMLDVFLC
jgi:4-hydroxybenzoate polyprenyltransferase